jgi:hypothetical protein
LGLGLGLGPGLRLGLGFTGCVWVIARASVIFRG